MYLSFIFSENIIVILNEFDATFCSAFHNNWLLKFFMPFCVIRIILRYHRVFADSDRISREESFCTGSYKRQKLYVLQGTKIILVHKVPLHYIFIFSLFCILSASNMTWAIFDFTSVWTLSSNLGQATVSGAQYHRCLDFFFSAASLTSGSITW